MTTMRRRFAGAATVASIAVGIAAGGAPIAFGHEAHAPLVEELVVYGRSQQSIGNAGSASEGLIGYQDIQLPPLLRTGELVEAVPGMVATQHSGTGKANQYFLRGFNLDHGTDFSAALEGLPINMRTHGHGQGYLDLNFLIPELIATTRYRKGPYHVAVGDFSSAGSVEFGLYERLPDNLLSATVGENDYLRGLAAGSISVAGGIATAALDVTRYAGPWELDENLEQTRFIGNYTFDVGEAHLRLGAQTYDSQWDSTDQIPLRAVDAGEIDGLGYIDPDLGGSSERYAVTAAVDYRGWTANAYLIDYQLSLYSDFTYFLDDPTAGDEFEQRDERTIYGFQVRGGRDDLIDGTLALNWGVEGRVDDIGEVGLFSTVARQRDGTVRRDEVEERSLGAFVEAELAITERLRGTAGLRADYYDWEVDSDLPVNGGSGDDSLAAPKLGLAYRFSQDFEGYLNWGRGFHSNDVRGATIAVDPVSGEATEPVPVLVDAEGGEVGVRFERGRVFNATLVGFWLDLDSELVFVGDAGTTEPNGATERRGIELTGFWQPLHWLALDASYTYADSNYAHDQGEGDAIPGAVESTFALGANAVWDNGLSASARLRYLGEAPLVEDDSVRADDSLLVNAGVGYRLRAMELRLDVFNLLDSDDHDISYFYASRLSGEPAEGVEDLHYHPLEPRTLRASVTWHL